MATVKITDLPYITSLQSNTANTVIVGVDIPSDDTGQITLTTLANGLYSNNYLKVGNNDIIFADAIGQFHGNASPYLQTVIHNESPDGSGDFVATADIGTDTTYYADVGIQGSNLSQGVLQPLDSYLISVGDTETDPGGNLVIGTDTVNKNINIVLGGHEFTNVVAQFLYDTGFKLTQKPLIFADDTTQNTAVLYPEINSRITANATSANSIIDTRISANVATLRGEITANAVSANSVINTRITSNIATVNAFAQAAFDTANNALANTSGTFDGELTITGNTNILNQLHIHNANMPGNNQFILVTGTAGDAISEPSNPGYTFHSAFDGGNRVAAEAYGANTSNYAAFIGRRGRGTALSPSAVQNGDIILRMGGNGYGATKFSQFADARIEFVATQTHTDTAKGTQIQFWTTPAGSNTASQIGVMNGDSITFTGVVSPQKGFIYVPRILAGAQTAITIDFANDSMIRAQFNNTLTISMSNYTYGKVVEVWLTNTAGNGQTVNLGALSNNITTGSSTLSVASGRSAKLQYFSIDGDQANTFVAVTYA
jgi:hypothetical protein